MKLKWIVLWIDVHETTIQLSYAMSLAVETTQEQWWGAMGTFPKTHREKEMKKKQTDNFSD